MTTHHTITTTPPSPRQPRRRAGAPAPRGRRVTRNRVTSIIDVLDSTTRHTTTIAYDPAGNRQILWYEYTGNDLTAIRDYTNRRVEYRYTGGLLTTVVDANGYSWTYGYTAGLPTGFTDPENRTVTRSWANNGELASIRYPDGVGTDYRYEYDSARTLYYKQERSTAGRVTETWLDPDGEVVRKDINGRTVERKVTDPQARTRTETDARGQQIVREVDQWDNLTRITYPDGSTVRTSYDPVFSNVTQKTDERGVITRYEYDPRGNLTRTTEAVGLPEQRITEYTYNDLGQRRTLRRLADAVTQEALTQYEYTDNYGNLTAVIDPEAQRSEFTYHVSGQWETRLDARGKTWRRSYDNRGNLRTDTDPLNYGTTTAYDRAGWRRSVTDAANNETVYGYDTRGNVTTVTDPYGAVTRYEYNQDNLRAKETDPENKVIKTSEYDVDGRPSRVTDGNGNVTQFVYGDDASGLNNLLVKIIYPTFSQEFKYDSRGRIVEVIDVLDANTRLSNKYSYDAKNRLVSVTDKENRTTSGTYDALDRLKTVTDPATGMAEATYDSRDNLLSLRDPKNQTHRFTYDRLNRKLTEVRPLGQRWAYTYTPTGQLFTVTDPKDQVKRFGYDDAERRTGESHFRTAADLANNNPARSVTYSFNNLDRLTGYSDGNVSTGTTTYDTRGLRKTGEAINFGTFSLSYGYNYFTNGRKRSFTGPDGVTVNYTYDTNNQLSAIQLPTGNIAINSYKWTLPAQITFPGGSVRSQTYDPLMYLTQSQLKDPGQSEVVNSQYTYDKLGNIKTRATEHGNYSYTYDNLDRLKTVTNPSPLAAESFTYDAVGNRLTDSKTTGTWSYNDNNQLQGLDGVTFEYDANGNTTRKIVSSDPAQTQTYVYDTSDRLIEVRDQNDGLIVTYTYDPFNRRIAKETAGSNGAKTWFFYAEEGLIAEADPSGAIVKSYGYKPDGTWTTDPVYLKQGSNTYYYFQNDHLGTPQLLIGQSGAVVWSARAESFGTTSVDAASTVTNNLRFAGQYFDAETGLHYNWMRYYDPKTGRYISSDPIQLADGFNTYAYAALNPLSLIDPWGLASTCYSQGPDCSPSGPAGGIFKQPPGGGCFTPRFGYGAIIGWDTCDSKRPPQSPPECRDAPPGSPPDSPGAPPNGSPGGAPGGPGNGGGQNPCPRGKWGCKADCDVKFFRDWFNTTMFHAGPMMVGHELADAAVEHYEHKLPKWFMRGWGPLGWGILAMDLYDLLWKHQYELWKCRSDCDRNCKI